MPDKEGHLTDEEQAQRLGSADMNLLGRLLDARAEILDSVIAPHFEEYTFDTEGHRLISQDKQFVLQWRVRRYPNRPIGHYNKQSTRGYVGLTVNQDPLTNKTTEALKSKCLEDLRAEYKKVIRERDEARLRLKVLSEQYAHSTSHLNTLKDAARSTVLWLIEFVLPDARNKAPVEANIKNLIDATTKI